MKIKKTSNKRLARPLATKKQRQNMRAKRPTHKKVLLHPVTILAMLCVGVLLVKLSVSASAVSYTVTAYVSAPIPPTAAVITSPADQATITTSPIDVTGTCPSNTYVKLYENNFFSGVDFCSGSNTFDIQTSLVSGTNQLIADVYNYDDQQGPTSSAVTVTYAPQTPTPSPTPVPTPTPTQSSGSGSGSTSTPTPTPDVYSSGSSDNSNSSSTTGTNSSTNTSTSAPIVIETEYHYQATFSNQPYSWPISIEGGVAPYALTINWDDGTQSTIAKENGDQFNLNHNYTQPSPPGGYIIKITGSDSRGSIVNLQLVALVRNQNGLIASVASGGNNSAITSTKNALIASWSAYTIIILLVVSFWLGERQELNKLVSHKRLKRRHA